MRRRSCRRRQCRRGLCPDCELRHPLLSPTGRPARTIALGPPWAAEGSYDDHLHHLLLLVLLHVLLFRIIIFFFFKEGKYLTDAERCMHTFVPESLLADSPGFGS